MRVQRLRLSGEDLDQLLKTDDDLDIVVRPNGSVRGKENGRAQEQPISRMEATGEVSVNRWD